MLRARAGERVALGRRDRSVDDPAETCERRRHQARSPARRTAAAARPGPCPARRASRRPRRPRRCRSWGGARAARTVPAGGRSRAPAGPRSRSPASRRPSRLPSGMRTSTGTRSGHGFHDASGHRGAQAQRPQQGAAQADRAAGHRGHRTLSWAGEAVGAARAGRRSQSRIAVPADEQAHPLGHQQAASSGAGQRCGGRGHRPAGGGRGQHPLAVAVEPDGDADPVGRQQQPDVVPAGDVVERRDVERLVDVGATGRVDVEQVGVPLAVGVVHLEDDRAELVVGRRHQNTDERVERVPERPGRGRASAPGRQRSRCDAARGRGTGRRRRGCRRRAGPRRGGRGRRSGRASRTGQASAGSCVEVDQPLELVVGEPVPQRAYGGCG